MRFTLAREELCEDRTGEGRVIELDREIGAVVLGGFRPGGADFGLADEDAVAWRVAAGICVGDDVYRLGLHRKGDDLALNFAGGGLREAADLGHAAVLSLGAIRTRAAWMRIGGQQGHGTDARGDHSVAKDGETRMSWIA